MTETPRIFPLRRRPSVPRSGERETLLEELARTRILKNQAYSCFNYAKDDELIDSYVYEINALQARYNYLLRRIKELEAVP